MQTVTLAGTESLNGYGYGGQFSRAEWRKLCREKLNLGKAAFEAWQLEMLLPELGMLSKGAEFGLTLCRDGLSEKVTIETGEASDYSVHFVPRVALDFSGTIFEEHLNFQNLIVHVPCLFDGCFFSQGALFQNSTFNSFVMFRHCQFDSFIHFDFAAFKSKVGFQESVFNGLTSFQNCDFTERAEQQFFIVPISPNFSGTTFHEECLFNNAVFSTWTWFYGAQFNKIACFDSVKFTEAIAFVGAEFHGQASFSQTVFDNSADLCGATFHDHLEFSPKSAKGLLNFSCSNFLSICPNFLSLDKNTSIIFTPKASFLETKLDTESIDKFSKLKFLADSNGQTDAALEFNALELKSKRNSTETSCFEKWVLHAYEKLSDFGRSIGTPLLVFLGLWLLSFGLSLGLAAYQSPALCKSEIPLLWGSDLQRTNALCEPAKANDQLLVSGYEAAFQSSTQVMLPFLPQANKDLHIAVNKRLFDTNTIPVLFQICGYLLSLLSLTCLFLTGLALRNRTRVKS